MRRIIRSSNLPLLALTLVGLSACGGGDKSAVPDGGVSAAQAAQALASPADASPASAPPLVPAATFDLATNANVTGVAMSPDGSRIAVSTQAKLGDPVTLRLYDAQTGAAGESVEVNTLGLWQLHWMADNRLVSADRDARLRWRVWDGATLAERPALPQDATCADGPADRATGAVYSTDGMAGMGRIICRFDTGDGAIHRTPEGLLVKPEQYWVRPGANEIVVLHSPDPDVSLELVTLDARTFARKSAIPVPFDETVDAVGQKVWIANNTNRTARLEPGGIAVPYRSSPRASGAGTVFVHSNGMDDFVFYAASDGRAIGTMPAGMNLGPFADWSADDSAFVRLTVDGTVEIYRF